MVQKSEFFCLNVPFHFPYTFRCIFLYEVVRISLHYKESALLGMYSEKRETSYLKDKWHQGEHSYSSNAKKEYNLFTTIHHHVRLCGRAV